MKPFSVLLLLALITQMANATTYYFSTLSGDDSRTPLQAQNPQTPWQTLDKFNAISADLLPGDAVLFKRGEHFYGTLTFSVNGTAGDAIYFGAYGDGENPTISGLTSATNWMQYSPGVYYVPLDVSSLNMVTIDGEAKGMGRYPNTGYLNFESHTGNNSITDNELPASPDWTGAEVVIRKTRFILDRHTVTSQSGNTLVYNAERTYGNNAAYSPADKNGYFLQNHMETLDMFGEWAFDNNTKRLYMYFGANDPAQYNVQASGRDYNASVSNSSYLKFENINFEGANLKGLNLVNVANTTITDCHYFNQGGTALYGIDLNGVSVKGGSVNTSFSNGVFFEYHADNCIVDGITVNNTNTIAGSGRSGDAVGIGIMVYGDHTTIRNNRVTNSGYNGIQFIGNDVLVERNYIDRFCLVKDDGGGIYTYTGSPSVINSHRRIKNNIILNAVGAYPGAEAYSYEPFGQGAGIYLDEFANNVDISGNTIANGDWGGILLHNVYQNSITGNLIYNHRFQVHVSQYTTATRDNVMTDNQYIARQPDQSTFYYRSYVADDPSTMGPFTQNYYARPMDDENTIRVDNYWSGGNGTTNISLATWQTAYSQDAQSKKSPLTFSSDMENNLRFEYNNTNAVKIVRLPASYVDVKNNQYAGAIGLEPFTAVVLMKSPVTFLPNQVITFPLVPGKTYGDPSFSPGATSTSDLPVSYRIVSGPATVAGNSVTITGAGEVVLEAYQNGNADFKPANPVQQSILVAKSVQSIDFAPLPDRAYGDAPFPMQAASSGSLPVAFRVVAGPAVVDGNTLSFTGAGNVIIEASQAGNENVDAAAPVEQSFTVAKGKAAITVSAYHGAYDGQPHGATLVSASDAQGNPLPPDLILFSNNSYTDAPGGVANWSFAGDDNHEPASGTIDVAILPADNQITFQDIANKTFGDAAFDVNVSALSGRPVSLSIVSGPATLSGPTLTLTGAGTVVVSATENGNVNYKAAAPVQKSFTVFKAAQAINFSPIPSKTYGDPAFLLEAVSTSGLPVNYSVVSGPATLNGNLVTITGAGTISINATQAGNNNYEAAATVNQVVVVAQSSQSIAFGPLAGKTYGDAPFAISATASSGLPVGFSVESGPATISNNVVTITGAGTVVITALQTGNSNYAAASVNQSFTVAQKTQSLSFAAIPNKTYGNPPFAISASATSGFAVSFRVVSGPATISGNMVTITGAGAVTIEASQPGDQNYSAAVPVTQSFTVAKAGQSVTFPAVSNKTYGNPPFNLTATASSGLAVIYRVVSGPATVSGSTCTLTGAGSVVLEASQPGDNNYNAAAPVQRSFSVAKANQTITFPPIPNKSYGTAPFTLSATASSGLPVTYTVVSGPAKVSGNTVTLTGTGKVTIRATQTGNGNYNAASPVSQSFNVTKSNVTTNLKSTQSGIDMITADNRLAPDELAVSVNPNPMRGQGRVLVQVGQPSDGMLGIYNSTGTMVQQLGLWRFGPGTVSLIRTDLSALPKGTYFIVLKTGRKSVSKAFLLL